MQTKQDLLEQIAADIRQQNVCPDLAKQARLVMGSGDIDADIVFIGEAPGEDEDRSGLPFVGKSGKLLDVMFSAAMMDRKDVYITNIVKYRPPNNRDPSTAEKDAFAPFLVRQLELIKPKAIVTLGKHSMKYFLPTSEIKDVHGQPETVVVNNQSFLLVPLYHPAYGLYGGAKRQQLIDEFISMKAIIDQA